jgi:hypothetical protein
MSENESSNSSNVADLQDNVAALQRQLFSLLLALIVVSGTLTVYLYRQASLIHKDIEAIKGDRQVENIVYTFNQNRAGMQTFLNELNDYAKTHPDFQLLLQKNGMASPAAKK